ncbi:hypothetical protein [Nitrobacter sp. JJSN]|uniref:hypothetical protein n=1 Tax=Nitrobacter sp. JJSN TaxID=3453033 RepID=UPI003F7638D6
MALERLRSAPDATGVNNVSGGGLDAEAKKKTGKTMEQLTEEKRKELDEKIKKAATTTSSTPSG